jgi:hypothetical protein
MTKISLGTSPKTKTGKANDKTTAKAATGAAGIGSKDNFHAHVEYVAKLDSKKRITVRSARAEYYAVTELAGGVIILKPQEAFRLEDLPEDVLAMIDEASANFKIGRVSAPIDLD